MIKDVLVNKRREPMSINFNEKMFTVEDVATMRNITVQAVRKAIAEERLSGCVKIAGVWFIPRRELVQRKWMKA